MLYFLAHQNKELQFVNLMHFVKQMEGSPQIINII